MSAVTTELHLALAAKPENLALVRQALSGLADGVSIPERGELAPAARDAARPGRSGA